jgi:hypothetical protein
MAACVLMIFTRHWIGVVYGGVLVVASLELWNSARRVNRTFVGFVRAEEWGGW